MTEYQTIKSNARVKSKRLNKRLESLFFKEIGLIILGLLSYYILTIIFDHSEHGNEMEIFVISIAALKVSYILYYTLKRMQKHLAQNLSNFYNCFPTLGLLVILTILSFSLDYLCLFDCNTSAFTGLTQDATFNVRLFEFNYFSLVTFATIGFGDIVPISFGAKILVMLEISTSFVMIVFIISNFHNLHYFTSENGADENSALNNIEKPDKI